MTTDSLDRTIVDLDPYTVLGVAPTATPAEIKAAHRRAVKVVHPDANGSAGLFRLVQAAYEMLADPERRRAYDRAGTPAAPPRRQAADRSDYVAESWESPGPETDYVAEAWESPGPETDYVAESGTSPTTASCPGGSRRRAGNRLPDWPIARWRISRLALALPVPRGWRGKLAALLVWSAGAPAIPGIAGRADGAMSRLLADLVGLASLGLGLLLLLRTAIVLGAWVDRWARTLRGGASR